MRAAGAGMLSAAVLFASGCGRPEAPEEEKGGELRSASYRSFAAADRLARCGWAGRPQAAQELHRYQTLKDFARRRGPRAAETLWQGENAWSGLARRGAQPPCGGGAAYPEAVTEFSQTLDVLANGILHHED
jgi:hypothetical protein